MLPKKIKKDYFLLNKAFSVLIPKLNQELKDTHGAMNRHKLLENKNLGIELVTQYVIFMRRDAWKDFEGLFNSPSDLSRTKRLKSIKNKASKRARLYQVLSPFSPEVGL